MSTLRFASLAFFLWVLLLWSPQVVRLVSALSSEDVNTEKAKETAQDTAQTVTETAKDSAQEVGKRAEETAKSAKQQGEEAAEGAKETGQSWTDWVYEKAQTAAKGTAGDEHGSGKEEGVPVTKQMGESLSSLKEKLSSYVSGKKDEGGAAEETVSATSQDTYETAKKKVGDAYGSAKSGVEEGSKRAKEHFESTASNVGEKIKQSVGFGSEREEL